MTIVELTRAARAATGENIGTVVKQGKWAVARYTKMPVGRTLARELLTPWGTGAKAMVALKKIAETGKV